MFIYKVIFLVSITKYLYLCAAGQKCFDSQEEFENECTNKYNGTRNGGRCFFLTDKRLNWTDAWAQCAAQVSGATLAQVLTRGEMANITNYIMSIPGLDKVYDVIFTALKRDSNLTSTSDGYAIDLNRSRWYDRVDYAHPKLTAGNTWLQSNHRTDDIFWPNHDCLVIWSNFARIGDAPCTNLALALCQIYNQVQNFIHVPDICANVSIIETFSNTACEQDCSGHCANYAWCRGFNYYLTASKCELVAIDSAESSNWPKNVPDCYYYTYDP